MRNIKICKDEILFSRCGELVRITPCAENAIRFQGFPDCSVIDENYTLMPKDTECIIEESENTVSMTCGRTKAVLKDNGKVFFYYDGKIP